MPFALRRLVYASLLWVSILHADTSQSYVLDNPHWLLIPKSVGFVEQLSAELEGKTGYHLYVAVVDSVPAHDSALSSKESRLAYKSTLTHNLPKPYTLIVFMREDKKIDIISSSPHTYLDENKVYDEYMIPLLPRERDEILSPQRVSAIVLNGYAQAADMIASHFGIHLENNMPVDESGGREFVRFCMYIMLLVMFGIIGVAYLRRKR